MVRLRVSQEAPAPASASASAPYACITMSCFIVHLSVRKKAPCAVARESGKKRRGGWRWGASVAWVRIGGWVGGACRCGESGLRDLSLMMTDALYERCISHSGVIAHHVAASWICL